jgi:hypothetical protein
MASKLYTVDIRSHDRTTFLKYLADNDFDQDHYSIQSHFVNLECTDNEGKNYTFSPGLGEHIWRHEDETFLITIKEEGDPTFAGTCIDYYLRICVQHPNQKVLHNFVRSALLYTRPVDQHKIRIYYSRSRGYWESFNTIYAQPFEKIYIDPEMKVSIIRHIDGFIASKERYIEFGRPYKLNFLLAGVCGSGKSSLIKAIALKYKRPLYVLNFSKCLNDENLVQLMADISDDAIILMEDIDAFFVNRDSKDNNVSFSALLNIMDGTMMKGNGVMMFLTANNPDHLDQALIRPGRIDRILKFDYPRHQEIRTAFFDITDSKNESEFAEFYKHIKGIKINMSSIVDYLFRYPTDYLDNIEELLTQTQIRQDIANDKSEKLYL